MTGKAENPVTKSSRDPGATLPDGVRRAALWCATVLIFAATASLVIALVVWLRVVTVPVLIALLATALVAPLARRLIALRVPRALAALAGCLVLTGVLGFAAVVVVVALVRSSGELVDSLKVAAHQVDQWLPSWVRGTAETGPVQTAAQQVTGQGGKIAAAVASGVISGVSIVVQGITVGILTLALVFFFLKDGRGLWSGILTLVPSGRPRDKADEVGGLAFGAMSGYVRGATMIAALDAVIIAIGAAILGLPGVLGLGALVFVGAYLPYVGSFISGAVAVLVGLADGGISTAVIMLAVVLATQALEGILFQPWVQSRTVALHPAIVLLSLTAGAYVAGIVGALLAVPVAAIVAVVGASERRQRAASPHGDQPDGPEEPSSPAPG